MNTKFVKEVVRVFGFAFLPVFVAAVSGISAVPDYSTGKALVIAAALAGAAAGIKAVLDLLTKGVAPAPGFGILPSSVKE